jgi:hypothetical protein
MRISERGFRTIGEDQFLMQMVRRWRHPQATRGGVLPASELVKIFIVDGESTLKIPQSQSIVLIVSNQLLV